jgi:membrane protein
MLNGLKDNVGTVKGNLDSVRDDFIREQGKKRSRIVLLFKLLYEFVMDMNSDSVGLYAAQSAFFSMLSAVPFFMIIVLCLKYVISVDTTTLVSAVKSTFPIPVSTYISGIVSEIFMRSESTALISATLITALWTSSRGIMAIYMGLNNIYGYTKKSNWLYARITALFYDILFIAVIVASVICLVLGNTILQLFGDNILAGYTLKMIFKLKYLIFFVLFVLAFAGLYCCLPQKKPKFLSQLPGAVTTAVGWVVFSYGFSVYIKYFSRYSLLYGSLTAIIFLMLWIFFCLYMLLIGAEVNIHKERGYFRRVSRVIFGKHRKKSKKR